MPKPRRKSRLLSAAALLSAAVAALPAWALQNIAVRDGASEVVRIAAKEPTRIKLDRGQIDDLIGDIRSADRNPNGRLIVEQTGDPSEIFVRPAPADGMEEEARRPINVFLKTSTGKTFGLLLQPVDMPADQVFLRERANESGSPAAARPLPQAMPDAPLPANANYLRAIKALWYAMASNLAPAGIEVRDTGRELALWKEVRLVQRRLHVGRQWQGETYELTNVSAEPLLLAEREFDREGVVFVSIETHRLAPGETTWVWVVRQRDPKE
jgi:conjugal transfer pilus assembly protein TraK